MGNITSLAYQKGSTLNWCDCCAWCNHSFIAPVGIFLWRMLILFFWLLKCILDLFITIINTLIRVLGIIWPFLVIFLGILLVTWVIWFGYPILSPYMCTIVIPFVELLVNLFLIALYIAITLWNLIVRIWNAAVQLIGMIIYIIIEIVLKILEEVINILGDIDIYSLLDPLIEISNAIMSVVTEIFNVLITVGKPILYAWAQVQGFLMKAFFKVIGTIIKIWVWLFQYVFQYLSPFMWVLQVAAKIFGGGRGNLQMHLLGLEHASSQTDSMLTQIFGRAGVEASRWWNNDHYTDVRMRELEHINQYISKLPPDSYDLYWSTQRPFSQGVRYPTEGAVHLYKGEPDELAAYAERGNRHLMSVAHERQLLSTEELQQFHASPVRFEEYWDCYHGKVADCETQDPHEWYMERVEQHRVTRQQLYEKAVRKLQEHNVTLDAPEDPATTKRPYEGELHMKVECKSELCGGEGTPLDHPILTLRKLQWENAESYERQQEQYAAQPNNRTRQQRDFIHMAVWSHAVTKARQDIFDRHLKNPELWKHAGTAFYEVTGHRNLKSILEYTRGEYVDAHHMMYEYACGMTDWEPLRFLVDQDPERFTRPYCSDFHRTAPLRVTKDPNTGRKLSAYIELSPGEHDTHRQLLEHVLDENKHGPISRALLEYAAQDGWLDHLPTHSPVRTATMRRLQDEIFGIVLPTPPFNSTDEKAKLQQRNEALEGGKQNPNARLPLFELLTKTNCRDTTPRNPLCLPYFPNLGRVRVDLDYPEIACQGNDDFCQPLYCIPPRDILDYRAWIGECHLKNGWTSLKLIFTAFFALFTEVLGLLSINYSFFSWIFQPFLILPAGQVPSYTDWICFVINLYALALWAFLIWLFVILVMPLIEWFIRSVQAFMLLYELFVASNEARRERRKDTAPLFRKYAYDSDFNPGVRYFNDPEIFGRDWQGRRAGSTFDLNRPPRGNPQQFSTYEGATSEWAPTAGRYHRSSFMPWQGQTTYERANAISPYTGDPRQQLSLPWNTASEESSLLISAALGQEPITAAVQEPPAPPTQEELQRMRDIQRLMRLEEALNSAAEEFGAWNWDVTNDELLRFERFHHWLLQSFHESFWWLMQYFRYEAKRRRIDLWLSPHQGEYRRGFTKYTENALTRTLRPNETPAIRPNVPRDMSV